ncbi:MAG: restriction endonuclease subunit S, partial [Sulfuricurvum sp.]|nr:restriction endonuclease subunit S [Sulfuricurvum sp.]
DKDFSQENKQFEILVSNPPYSVSAFKNTSREYYRENDFELYDKLTDNSSEIECLFVERTKQLLKDGGVAGVILPSSILSNTGIYAKTREIILQYFEIVGIAELGSNTFMATGTNTVTLFMRRRNNYDSINLRIAIEKFFNVYQDVTLGGIEKPITKYVNHVWENISFDDYISMLKCEPNENIAKHDIYTEYRKKLKVKNDKEFWNLLLEREAEKLYYFILTYPQKVVLIKSGEKDAEKRFLGYEFSNRRGSEGIHPIQRGKSIDECTQLFDSNVFDNPTKASTYIYKAFEGDFDTPIDKTMINNVSRHHLVDMLTFDRVEFEKNISLSVKKKLNFEKLWNSQQIISLAEISEIRKGTSITKEKTKDGHIPVVAGGQEPAYFHNESNRDGNIITISASGAYSGFVNYFDKPIFASDCNTVISKDEKKISTKLIYEFLKSIQKEIYGLQRGQAQPHVYAEDISKIKIPLPSSDIQKKIVSEIKTLEVKEKNAKDEVYGLKNNISTFFINLNYQKMNLGSISDFKNGLNYSRNSLGESINIVGVSDFQNRFSPDLDILEKIQIDGNISDDYLLKKNDILVVRSNGSSNLVGRFLFIDDVKTKTSFSGFTIRVRVQTEDVNAKFLCYYLKTDLVRNKIVTDSSGSNIKSLNQTLLSNIKVPLPPLSEQQKIVSEIEKIETQIALLETQIAEIPKQKEAVLKKYL